MREHFDTAPVRLGMTRIMLALLACAASSFTAAGKPVPAPSSDFAVREIHYTARLADDEARLTLDFEADAPGAGSVKILEGDIAVLPAKLPDALTIVREKDCYRLVAPHAGHRNKPLPPVTRKDGV